MRVWIKISWFLVLSTFTQLILSNAVTNNTFEGAEDELVLAQVVC